MISQSFVGLQPTATAARPRVPAWQRSPVGQRLSVVLIIPTYNERINVGRLIDRLQDTFASLPHEMQILVVDDHSPDGTADAVREQRRRTSNVHLLEGQKHGLGAAYIRGMRYAIDVLQADVVFQMDADFSHQPSDVPRLLAALEQGADLVIGSRYVAGGTVPRQWSFRRRLNSRCGNAAARYIAGLHRVRDCTAGFRGIRTSVLRRIDIDRIRVQGYAFQIALLHAATVVGANIVELPVDFIDRSAGESKLGMKDVAEFLRSVLWIRFQSSQAFGKFCVVGTCGVLVNLGLFTALLAFGVNEFLASPIAILCSIVTNFLGNHYWTFGSRPPGGPVRARGLRLNVVAFLALVVSYSTFVVLSRAYPGVRPQVHQLLGVIPATLLNYFFSSYWTFRSAARDPGGRQ
jgi:dolichol-phosphate mannosyltransferase